MNLAQTIALDTLKKFVVRDAHRALTEIEVSESNNNVYAILRTDFDDTVAENSALRILCGYESWVVRIGKRGAVYVHSCPDSYKQFSGRRAFNMNFGNNL